MTIPLPHLFIYLSSLELPNLFISSINYLTFSFTSLLLSPLEISNLLISPVNCTPNFLFKSYVGIFFSLHVVPIVLLLFESQRCVLSPLVSDWLYRVSCFYLFIYLVFLFCSIFLVFGFWCSLFRSFYNFVVPKFFSSNVLIVVLTSFVFLFILMLYNIRLIRLDIFLVHRTGLRLV
jgi:hypothetical protein